jgi:prephenate dehydratase
VRLWRVSGQPRFTAGIETTPNNYTRFFVISKKKAEPSPKSKTSLVFGTKNLPGALYACLGAFATRNINLTKLESRPRRDKPWEYIFYVDFEGHIDDPVCQEALIELKQNTNFIKILGCYSRAGN